MTGTTGKYRIQTVSQLTGVSPATLRAWERRYGFPSPQRTSSSYRLYSDQDVSLIRRLVEQCSRGVAPSEAAKSLLAEAGGTLATEIAAEPALESVREQILEAISSFSADRLHGAIRSALFLAPAELAVHQILVPTLHEVGDRWHEGTFSVAHEHFATAIIGTTLHDLLRLASPAEHAQRILLACPEHELHSLALFTVGFTLLRWGWHPIILGANTPVPAVAAAVEAVAPTLIGLSITHELPPDREMKILKAYAEACGAAPWVVGGQLAERYESLIDEAGGHVAIGGAPQDLQALLEDVLGDHRPATGRAPPRAARVSRAKTKTDDE